MNNVLESIHIDIPDFLEDIRFDYQHSGNFSSNSNAFSKIHLIGDWVMACCPNHSESRASFGISREAPYHCNCFYCGYLGTIDRVVELALGLEEGQGIHYLLAGYAIEEKRSVVDIANIIANGREKFEVPCMQESAIEKFDNQDTSNWIYQSALSYLYGRGITQHAMNVYSIKVDVQNACIVFPQRTRLGELRFLQKRKIGNNFSGAKFINEGSPIKKDILFGLNFINQFRATDSKITRVRLVESPLDVISNYRVGIAAVGLNGKILFNTQIRELALAGVRTVDLMLDNDQAGREASVIAHKKLKNAGFIVNTVITDNAYGLKDSNDFLMAGWLDKLQTKNTSILGKLLYI